MSNLEVDDDFGGDFLVSEIGRSAGIKVSFGGMEDDEDDDDIFGSRNGNPKTGTPGVATGMILSLRESIKNYKDLLATSQTELAAANSQLQKWHSSFQNEPFIPQGTPPEPELVMNHLHTLRSSEGSLKDQVLREKKKEAAFIVTLAKREQEIAELKSAVRDLRAQLRPPSLQTRQLLLDPAIHEEFTRLKNLVHEKDKRVKELQDNIAAVTFTANSRTGKMLMAKCRTLQEENEEIGNQASEGRIHDLAMKLALQKSQNAEMRSHLEGLYKHVDGLTCTVEKSNELVLVLQEQLEERDNEINRLKCGHHENTPSQKSDSVSDQNDSEEVASGEEDMESCFISFNCSSSTISH